jgi:hypothetical protein
VKKKWQIAKREMLVARNKAMAIHGMWRSKEFKAWDSMQQRCHNPRNKDYHRYGARGIQVCRRWRKAFLEFYNDMGPSPSPQHSIDRVNPNRGYYKKNCRWATPVEQQNNIRSNRRITYRGRTQTVAQWGRELGFKSRQALAWRLDRWPVERAFTAGPQGKPCKD